MLAIVIVISAASAVDLAGDFNNKDFKVNVLSATSFNETVNISTNNISLVVFENSGNNSKDVNSLVYFKDSSANKNEINAFIKDLEKNGNKVEETDKYIVLKNTQKSSDFDISNNLDGIFDFAGSIFSSDGLNVSSNGNSVSFSDKGLEISDANGENVSITSEGVSVSGNGTVSVSSSADSNIENCDYSIYLKNSNNDKVIVISGNDLELLKEMAKTVSFNGN